MVQEYTILLYVKLRDLARGVRPQRSLPHQPLLVEARKLEQKEDDAFDSRYPFQRCPSRVYRKQHVTNVFHSLSFFLPSYKKNCVYTFDLTFSTWQ
jgi:hypothetical protein